MASSSPSISLSRPPIITSILNPKPSRHFHRCTVSFSTIYCSHTELAAKAIHFHNPCRGIAQKRSKIWRSNATSGEVLPTESTPLETSQEMVSSTGDESLSSVISVLLFAAFIALSILTIGVVYIGVTDFLQKREREKFEKTEAATKKKKKVKAKPRAGPRGFGQKIDDDDD
ncbi:hypothetical protein WN943_026561 [Citrus x changshan-huyou]